MGLPLRNSSSFSLPTSGAAPPGGPSVSPESDPDMDLDTAEPAIYRPRHLTTKQPRRSYQDGSPHAHAQARHNESCRNRPHPHAHRKALHLRTTRLRQQHTPSDTHARPAAAETHHIKPRNPWAADADEGCALARSTLQLPGECTATINSNNYYHHYQYNNNNNNDNPERHHSRSRSCSASGTRRRPPSLERQDAFRDEKTAKRRRSADDTPVAMRRGRAELEEADACSVTELYRLGLLYDDEHERGAEFSLAQIVREEPAYSLRVRPAKRGRREEGERRIGFVSMSCAVDLAFSAFGEDEALARWLLSGSTYGSSHGTVVVDEPRQTRTDVHDDTPRLTVIYELADAGVSDVSADDFLDSVSVSEISCCSEEEEEEDELAWAVLDGCVNGTENAAPPVAVVGEEVDDDVDPWVVLGLDGS